MVSIVVSIYNVEKYLNRCVESLLDQTYQDYEIILIDDGSPDGCPAICDEWGRKEKKIHVFHKKNGGLSSARNYGIKHAKGEFIIFPDPDDWVEPEYLETLLSIKENNKADLSICGHYRGECVYNKNADRLVMETEKALEQLMLPDSFCGYVWNKLFSLKIIKENNVFFDEELGMVQDLHFCVRYFQYCRKIAYDPIPVYHYSVDGGGVTSRFSPLSPRKISGLSTYKKIGRITHDKYPQIEEIAYSSLCKMCLDDIMIYYRSGRKSKDTIKLLWEDFRKYRRYFYKCKAYKIRDKRCSRIAVIHPCLYYYSRRIYWKFFIPLSRKKKR